MRLQCRRVRSFSVRPRSVVKNNEGVPEEIFGDAFVVKGYMWPATSKRQIEQYGDRIANIANVRLAGKYSVSLTQSGIAVTFASGEVLHLGDGLCVNAAAADKPDYIIRSVSDYSPLLLEVEHRV